MEDAFGTRDFTVVAALGEATVDYRDDKLDPTEGFYLQGSLTPFHEANFSNTGARLVAEGRAYADFGSRGRTIVAGRLKAGSVLSPPIDETSSSSSRNVTPGVPPSPPASSRSRNGTRPSAIRGCPLPRPPATRPMSPSGAASW